MKVLHICTQDSGGAGIAAYRLHIGLKSIGVESKMLVLHRSSSDGDVVRFVQNNNIFRRQWDKFGKRLISSEFNVYKDTRPRGLELFSDDRTIYNIGKHSLVRESDIINLRWITRMVDHREFFRDVHNKAIVWRLSDMNPFTGGCHYSQDCTKYETGCGACPQLGSMDTGDLSRRIFKRKEKAYKDCNIHVVTPSRWLAACARRSQLFRKFNVDIIPNGLSTSIFTERDKQYSRELLGLPKDKILILFGAQSVTNIRKGIYYLEKALMLLRNRVDDLNIGLAIFGSNSSAVLGDAGFSVYPLGTIHDELLLSCVYSAVDVFVMPSLQDNFPNTVLESFACGTPVIGFSIGGVVDMIKPGETGLLVKSRDAGELAEQIKWMIDHSKERKQMGLNARKVIEQEYTLEIQAKRYQELYSSLSET